MKESLKSYIMRHKFNLFPSFRRSGGRITYISSDLKHVEVKIPLNWQTKNIVGTIYGGSMYSAIDPIYMVMFMKILGPEYIVWDKSAKIDFKRPGIDELVAKFDINDEQINGIKEELNSKRSTTRCFNVDLLDKNNKISARIEKVIFFQKNNFNMNGR